MRLQILAIVTVALLGVGGTAAADGIIPGRVDTSPKRVKAEELATASSRALANKQFDDAYHLAQAGLAIDPHDPWLMYDAGLALAGLGRTDDAYSLLVTAEKTFRIPYGKQIAAYARAMILANAARCEQASVEYHHYAKLAGGKDRRMAERYAAECFIRRENVAERGRRGGRAY